LETRDTAGLETCGTGLGDLGADIRQNLDFFPRVPRLRAGAANTYNPGQFFNYNYE
jgi:hypothetical protein